MKAIKKNIIIIPGGVWVFHDEPVKTHTRGALYHCLVLNSSKYMTNFSDFPYPESSSPYIQGKKYISYLKVKPLKAMINVNFYY